MKLQEVRFRQGLRGSARAKRRASGRRLWTTSSANREIERLLGCQSIRESAVRLRNQHPEDAEEAAERLRHAWRLGEDPLPNVWEMLEAKGILVFEVEAPETFNGFAGRADGHPFIVLAPPGLSVDLPRKRFTSLHEAGHLLLIYLAS